MLSTMTVSSAAVRGLARAAANLRSGVPIGLCDMTMQIILLYARRKIGDKPILRGVRARVLPEAGYAVVGLLLGPSS